MSVGVKISYTQMYFFYFVWYLLHNDLHFMWSYTLKSVIFIVHLQAMDDAAAFVNWLVYAGQFLVPLK